MCSVYGFCYVVSATVIVAAVVIFIHKKIVYVPPQYVIFQREPKDTADMCMNNTTSLYTNNIFLSLKKEEVKKKNVHFSCNNDRLLWYSYSFFFMFLLQFSVLFVCLSVNKCVCVLSVVYFSFIFALVYNVCTLSLSLLLLPFLNEYIL